MKVPVSNVVQMPQAQGPKINPTMLAMAAHMMIQEGKLGPQAQPKPNDSSDQQRR